MKLTLTTIAAAALIATAAQASVPGVDQPLPRDTAEGAQPGFSTTGTQTLEDAADRLTPRDLRDLGNVEQLTVSTFNSMDVNPAAPQDPTLYR